MASLPPDPRIRSFLQGQLAPDETIRWSSRPAPSAFGAREAPAALIGTAGLGFAAFAIAASGGFSGKAWAGAPASMLAGLLPFLLIAGVGLYLLASPLWAMRRARFCAYTVTDRRAIIVTSGNFGKPRLQSFSSARLGAVERRLQPDGSGDVVLNAVLIQSRGRGMRPRRIGFFATPDAEAAYQAVRGLVPDIPPGTIPPAPVLPAYQRIGLPLVFLLFGSGLLWLGGGELIDASRSSAWPRASGVILRATLQTIAGRHVSRHAQITYAYRVAGRQFQRVRVAYGDSSASEREAEILQRYHPGATVPVSYDPVRPGESVLEPGIRPSAWQMPELGAFFTLLAASLAWSFMSSYQGRPTPEA